MALIPPMYLDCVVAIGTRRQPADDTTWVASGFLFGRFLRKLTDDQSQYVLFLVTNSHVLKDAERMLVRLNPTGEAPAKELTLELVDSNGKRIWSAHPKADLAVVTLNSETLQREQIPTTFFHSDKHTMDIATARDSGLSEGDGVYVLGFPMGIVGGGRNFVIVREGCIARIRDALAGSSTEIVLDVSIFPGNSGGPVVLKPQTTAIQGTSTIGKSLLVGIVTSYLPYRDTAISQQTGRPRVTFEENSGLAVAIPVDFINELIEEHMRVFSIHR